jgi:hypothetical protein
MKMRWDGFIIDEAQDSLGFVGTGARIAYEAIDLITQKIYNMIRIIL